MSAPGQTAAGGGRATVVEVPRAPSRGGVVVLAVSLVVTAITVAAAGVATLGLDDLKVVVDDPHRVSSALDTVVSSPSSKEWTSPHDVEVWVTGMQLNAALTVVGLALWWRIVRAATRAGEAAVARD